MQIPASLLVHTVDVETKTGDGAFGETYAPPVTVACYREAKRRLVRGANGDQALSGVTLYCAPGQAATFTAGSRVTWDGCATTVMAAQDHDSGGLGAPDHTEVSCE